MGRRHQLAESTSVRLNLPKLLYGPEKTEAGTVAVQLRAAETVEASPDGEVNVSARIKEPVFVLPSGERLVVTTRRNVARPGGTDGLLLRGSDGALGWLSHVDLESLEY